MSQLDHKLWIGSYTDVSNREFMDERGITHILCCAKECEKPPYLFLSQYRTWHLIPIAENEMDSMTELYLKEGAKKINEWIRAGHTVILHCLTGNTRSVSTAIAYYMIYKSMSFSVAYRFIKQHRNLANPDDTYIDILIHLDSVRHVETTEQPPNNDSLNSHQV